jgi:Putative beta-barrel porin-2, OmpL-like. bbp2
LTGRAARNFIPQGGTSMNVIKISALGLAGLLATTVHADPKLTISGNIDSYYTLNLSDNVTPNVLSTATGGSNGVANRAFDTKSNEFAFEGGELNLASVDDATKTGAFVNLLVGPKANLINANNGLATSNFMVGQAFINKTWGDAKLTFGKFPTFIGTEVEAVTGDNNFSRGLVYGLEPVYNTGIKLDYSLPASFTLTGQFDNGNSVDDAANEGKGYGVALAWAAVKNLGLTASWSAEPGAKIVTTGGIPYTDFVNVLASYQATDSLGFNAEYLYKTTLSTDGGITPSTKQNAYALYANWATPMKGLSLLPRFEQVFSPDNSNAGINSTTTPATLAASPYAQDSYTLTLKYVDGPLTHFLEYRADASDLYQYSGPNPTSASDLKQIAQTVTYAAAYSF